MTRYLVYASIFVASASLGLGFVLAEHISSGVTVGLLGMLWAVAYRRGFTRFNGLTFALFVFISVLSVNVDVSPWLALISIIFSLITWDLLTFIQRLQMVQNQEDHRKMERAHLVRLLVLNGLAFLGFVGATRLRINLTFGGAALLALLAIWGISTLVYRLRSHE